MAKVDISVLMTVYDGQRFLVEAIESILKQTFKSFEFIIVDDGSTDHSWWIIKKYAKQDKRIVLIHNRKNLGTTRALNVGLAKVRGRYMVRMDSDDWSYPDRLAKQYKFMNQHKEVGVSGGVIEVCDEKLQVLNKRQYPLTDQAVRKVIFRYSPFAHPATIWRTKLLKSVGGYNPNIILSQDYELYFRMGNVAKFGNLETVLLKLRTHQSSSSILRGRFQEQFAVYSRIKALMEFGYKMTTGDKIYTFLQIVSMGVLPARMKFWIFNFFRRTR